MATRKFPSNDSTQSTYSGNWEQEVYWHIPIATGNFTADVTYTFLAPFAGKVSAAYFGFGENGADATDPQNTDMDVKINGTSALSTLPKLDKTAGTGAKSTVATGTGITNGVVNQAANTFSAGAQITVILNITRTTPDTESASPSAVVVVKPNAN